MTRTLALLPPLGHPASIYDPLVTRLAPAIEVIALGYPLAELDLGAEDLLGALAERLVRELRPRAPDAIGGISLGATLCYRLAPHLDARVLVLMSPGGPPPPTARREGALAALADLGPAEFARRHFALDVADAPAACALLRAALDADFSSDMARLAGDIHVLWGDQDRVFNARHMERLRQMLPPHHFHVLTGVGHYPPDEAPDRVADIIRAALGVT